MVFRWLLDVRKNKNKNVSYPVKIKARPKIIDSRITAKNLMKKI